MTLESILTKIKPGKGLHLLEDAHPSLSMIDEETFYIQPSYEEIQHNTNAKCVLFSAPGASGKTALAKYLAFRYKGLYWDLAKITLGENSFHGTLWRAMRQENLLSFFDGLKTGENILILDAFDEAELISGRNGIEYFLNDLLEIIKDSTYPTILMFARTESASYIEKFFQEKDIDYSYYEIGFFEEYNAKNFIKEKLKNQKRSITQPIRNCIDQQFNAIKRLLGEGEISKSFLGYAPVLEALAQSIEDEANTSKLLEELKKTDKSTTSIIHEILDFLLEREHQKVCHALKEKWVKDYSEFNDWDIVYTKEEQMVRIVEYVLFKEVSPDSFYDSKNMPPELYSSYIDSLQTFLQQHPFLQNTAHNHSIDFTGPAFRDYSLAFLLSKFDYEDLGFEYFSDKSESSHFPSQLLFDFFVFFSESEMEGALFPLLYDSFKAKETSTNNVSIDVFNNGGDEAFATFRLSNTKSLKIIEEQEFHIKDNKIYISRLANANIDLDGSIFIGDSKNSTRIENSFIMAKQINLNTTNICIEAHDPNSCVWISIDKMVNSTSETPKFEIKADSKDLIKISIPNINNYYKLIPYKYDFTATDSDEFLKFQLFIKKVMGCLRKHKKDTPAKDKEFIDNEIICESQFKQKVMDFLISKNIIYIDSKENHLYKLNVDSLSKYGLNWVGITQGYNNGIKELYDDFSVK